MFKLYDEGRGGDFTPPWYGMWSKALSLPLNAAIYLKWLLFLILVLPFNTLSAQNVKEYVYGTLRYRLVENQAVCLGGAYHVEQPDTVVIPKEIVVEGRSYPVTEIGDNAFASSVAGTGACKHVVLPKGLKRIGDVAFTNNRYDVALPDYVSSDTLFLPEGLESVGACSFLRTNVKYVYIPASVTSIGWGAFAGCDSLRRFIVSCDNPVYSSYFTSFSPGFNAYPVLVNEKERTICCVSPYGSEPSFLPIYGYSLGRLSLYNCKRLKEFRYGLVLSPKVYKIGEDAFSGCDSLERIDFSTCWSDSIVFEPYPANVFCQKADSTKSPINALADMFGDLPRLRSLSFNSEKLSSDIMIDGDNIFYVLEKQEGSAQPTASVLFVPRGIEQDTLRFSTIGDEKVSGVKYGAFGWKVNDVYFSSDSVNVELAFNEQPDAYNPYNAKNNSAIRMHVPYHGLSNAPLQNNYYDVQFYGDNDGNPGLYGTIYFEQPFVISEGLRGAVVSGVDDRVLRTDYQYMPGDTVPANTGLLLNRIEENGPSEYRLELPCDVSCVKAVVGENYLRGYAYPSWSWENTHRIESHPNELYYMLSYDKNHRNIGFYWGADNGESFESRCNRAYLALPSSVASQVKAFRLDGEETTGVLPTWKEASERPDVYNLQGIKLNQKKLPTGIYVIDGKKVLIK